MKVGDLVEADHPLDPERRTRGVIVSVAPVHWDKDLPGYVPGGSTYRVQWVDTDATFHDGEELELISES